MALQKKTYVPHVTKVSGENLNEIQDAIIALENDNLDSRLDAVEPVVSTLNDKWSSYTINTAGDRWQTTLTAGKMYLLIIGKLNMNPTNTGYLGLYIISAYTASGDSDTAIRAVATSSVATVAASGTTLTITSGATNYVNCTLIQMN